MSTGEVFNGETTGSGSSPSNQPCQVPSVLADHDRCTDQPALQVVKIPSRKILNLMLDKLDLPRAKYEFCEAKHHQVRATVTLYTSTHGDGGLLRRVVMRGAKSTDPEIAEESVALEGIRYMENLENMVVEDLNFSELEYVHAENKDLRAKLKASEEAILAQRAGLHLALQAMTAISHRLYQLTDTYRSVGQSNADMRNNAALELFDKVTFDLQHSSGYLTKFL